MEEYVFDDAQWQPEQPPPEAARTFAGIRWRKDFQQVIGKLVHVMDEEVVVHRVDEPQGEERNIERHLQDAQKDTHGFLVLVPQQVPLHERPPGFGQPELKHIEQVERQGNDIPNRIRVLPS